MPRNWLVLLLVGLSLNSFARADEPLKTYEVVSPKDIDIIATGINGRGDVVGFEWAEEKERPGVIEQKPFFARGKSITYLPLMKGYTTTLPAAASDEGLVVGRVGKPITPGKFFSMGTQAFVWDVANGIRGLGVLKNDTASVASGVSRDGKRVSGYSVGENSVRACVWDRDGDGWKGTPLPQAARLGSNTVAISGNGKNVSAVDGTSACLWSLNDFGEWNRTTIAEMEALLPRAVNDSGTVVGVCFAGNRLSHGVVWTRKGGRKQIEEPEGYVRSEANAVNNLGVVVGFVDGANGSKIGPDAFVYANGRLRLLNEGGAHFGAATAINDKGQIAGVLEKKEE